VFTRCECAWQWWACSLVNAQPYGGKKKGADTGIDGLIFFQDDTALPKKVVVSVKGGENVGITMVKDLIATCQRQKAEIGLFVTLNTPTKPMIAEANPRYPRLDAGGLTFKKAQVEHGEDNQHSLFDASGAPSKTATTKKPKKVAESVDEAVKDLVKKASAKVPGKVKGKKSS